MDEESGWLEEATVSELPDWDVVGKIDVVVNQEPFESVRISTTPVSVNGLPAEFVVVIVVVYSVGFVPGAVGTGLQAILQDAGKFLDGTGPE